MDPEPEQPPTVTERVFNAFIAAIVVLVFAMGGLTIIAVCVKAIRWGLDLQ